MWAHGAYLEDQPWPLATLNPWKGKCIVYILENKSPKQTNGQDNSERQKKCKRK